MIYGTLVEHPGKIGGPARYVLLCVVAAIWAGVALLLLARYGCFYTLGLL